jgi:hypothetical protein
MTTAHPTAPMLIIKFHKIVLKLLEDDFPMDVGKIFALSCPMFLNFILVILPDASYK